MQDTKSIHKQAATKSIFAVLWAIARHIKAKFYRHI